MEFCTQRRKSLMRSKLLTAIALIIVSLSVMADDGGTFLCIPEAATGFKFDEAAKKWEQANLDISGVKYLIKPTTDEDRENDEYIVFMEFNDSIKKGNYVVKRFGDTEVSYWCDSSDRGMFDIRCEGTGFALFVFDATAGRYARSYLGKYINSVLEQHGDLEAIIKGEDTLTKVPDRGGDPPVIEIGQCSEI